MSFPNDGLWFWLNLRKLRFPTVKHFLGMDAGESKGSLTWFIPHGDMNGVRANGTPCLVVCWQQLTWTDGILHAGLRQDAGWIDPDARPGSGPVNQLAIALDMKAMIMKTHINCCRTLTGGANRLSLSSSNSESFSLFLTKCTWETYFNGLFNRDLMKPVELGESDYSGLKVGTFSSSQFIFFS